jgi:hypothetical protein
MHCNLFGIWGKRKCRNWWVAFVMCDCWWECETRGKLAALFDALSNQNCSYTMCGPVCPVSNACRLSSVGRFSCLISGQIGLLCTTMHGSESPASQYNPLSWAATNGQAFRFTVIRSRYFFPSVLCWFSTTSAEASWPFTEVGLFKHMSSAVALYSHTIWSSE